MKTTTTTTSTWLSAAIVACVLTACGVDAGANKNHRKCEKGETAYEGFCIPAKDGGTAKLDSGAADGGRLNDAALTDASTTKDSSMPEVDAGAPCHEGDFCYEYDGDYKTRANAPCRSGTKHCVDGKFDSCLGQITPVDELCDGVDNDCNAVIDDKVQSEACENMDPTAKGICKNGETSCENKTSVCRLLVPISEICNGQDDDCDGTNDEGISVDCYPDDATGVGCDKQSDGSYKCFGLCMAGKRACVSGSLATCSNAIQPAAAEVCTGSGDIAADEDCDDKVDEGCPACTGGTMQDCYEGAQSELDANGECKPGKRTCIDISTSGPAVFAYGACENQVRPKDEACDNPGKDDDCDGVDDNIFRLGMPCTDDIKKGVCRTGVNECPDPVDGPDMICKTPEASAEICDQLDNNCEGRVDENTMLQTDENNCGMCGKECTGSNNACCAAQCVNTNRDELNCGMCGKQCGDGKTCCDASGCVDTQSDELNCGACGIKCGGSETCCAGECKKLGSDPNNCGACGAGCTSAAATCCSGSCKNLLGDDSNCGMCGKACGLLIAGLLSHCNGAGKCQ